ncbi:MAG TPA: pentapeptide repeat-containing protein, partial [bacterium]|nr:pentapeptide repeat-containing protein [bacterium]
VLVEAGLVTAALLTLLLWLREALTERQRQQDQWQRELRHLAPWAGEEGILRKVGLIRDLNLLDAAPATLEQAMLAGADLRGCNLRGCQLKGANLSRSDLQGAVLDGASLWDADLSGANLSLASLKNATLRGCNLEGANLAKANLAGANLNRANLVNANLYGAHLEGASLVRARFALRQPGGLEEALHASVEDWIRARLDARGYYVPPSRAGAEAADE